MSWECEPLWAKSRLFIGRAFDQPRDDSLFGLWCSLGLEVLARAALASVSPTLLSHPERDHRHLLFALNRGNKGPFRSLGTAQVFGLCRVVFPEFTEEDFKAANALLNRRNDELHTGATAFDDYPAKHWLTGFYRACKSLTGAMGRSLDALFGTEEAKEAEEILNQIIGEVKHRVESAIADHRKAFEKRSEPERVAAAAKAEEEGKLQAHEHRHRVICPSCKSHAMVEGKPFGPDRVTNEDDEIIVRRSVSPRRLSCSACGLKLEGYGELEVANLAGQYTRTVRYSPEEYYGLVDPNSFEFIDLVSEYLGDHPDFIAEYLGANEYDNE